MRRDAIDILVPTLSEANRLESRRGQRRTRGRGTHDQPAFDQWRASLMHQLVI